MTVNETLTPNLPPDTRGTTTGNANNGNTELVGTQSDTPISNQVCKKCGQVHVFCRSHDQTGTRPCIAKGPHPKYPNRCTSMHPLPGFAVDGGSNRRYLHEHRDEVNVSFEEHLWERGLSRDTAPVSARNLCKQAARLAVLLDHRADNAEKTADLTKKYTDLLRALDSLHPTPESRVSGLDANTPEAVSHLPLPVIEARIWQLEVQLHPDSGTRPAADILREIVAEAERAAIDIEAIRRAEREAAMRRSAESKHTVPDIPEPPVASTPEPQAATPATPTQRPPTQPLPPLPPAVVIEMRKFLNEPRDEPSEADIKQCLTWSGDWASYESGQLTRAEAVTMTTQWLRSKKGLAR
jgi:hypothetical protein